MSQAKENLSNIRSFNARENHDQIVLFKCKDWTTEILGRVGEDGRHYVQRPDGDINRTFGVIEWSVPLARQKEIKE